MTSITNRYLSLDWHSISIAMSKLDNSGYNFCTDRYVVERVTRKNLYIYINMYIYIHVYMYTYICIYMYIYIHIHTYIYIYIHIYIYIYIYIHMYIYKYIYIYLYIYLYFYMYTYLYTSTFAPWSRTGASERVLLKLSVPVI
jgi:hypothetical protein